MYCDISLYSFITIHLKHIILMCLRKIKLIIPVFYINSNKIEIVYFLFILCIRRITVEVIFMSINFILIHTVFSHFK